MEQHQQRGLDSQESGTASKEDMANSLTVYQSEDGSFDCEKARNTATTFIDKSYDLFAELLFIVAESKQLQSSSLSKQNDHVDDVIKKATDVSKSLDETKQLLNVLKRNLSPET